MRGDGLCYNEKKRGNMAEETKKKRGQKKVLTEDVAEKPTGENAEVSAETSTEEKPARKTRNEEFLEAMREELAGYRDEIATSVRLGMQEDFAPMVREAVRREAWRRKWSTVAHDFVIVGLAISLAFAWIGRSQDEKYIKSLREQVNNVADVNAGGPIKDETWYLANYRYLFDGLQTELNADDINSYYLYSYSGNLRVAKMDSEVLLAMAYNQAEKTTANDATQITDEQMRTAFVKTFGSAEAYRKVDFQHGCLKFEYDKKTDTFTAPIEECERNQRREILEDVERIYEEGETLYVLTVAGVYDRMAQSLYSFADLFRPIVANVGREDFESHKNALSRYQYQFLKGEDDNYHFAGVTRLR